MPRAGLGVMALPLAIAALWGLAEATVFFIVADVPISAIAVRYGLRSALLAALAAALGAMAGVALFMSWAAQDPDGALALVERVPFVTEAMTQDMRADLLRSGLLAVLAAGVTGVPIKLAAVLAPTLGMAPAPFLAAAFAQRIARFAAAAVIATLLSRRLKRRTAFAFLTAFWIAFYALYWSWVG